MRVLKRTYEEIIISSDESGNSDFEIIEENIKLNAFSKSENVFKQKQFLNLYPQFKLMANEMPSDYTISSEELLRAISVKKTSQEVHLLSSFDTSPSLIENHLNKYSHIKVIILTPNPEIFIPNKRLTTIKLKVNNNGWPDRYHSKFLIKMNDDRLEIYIGTGNFNEVEFEAVQNLWFFSGRLHKLDKNTVGNKSNIFLQTFNDFFFKLAKRMDSNDAKLINSMLQSYNLYNFDYLKNYSLIVHNFDMTIYDILGNIKSDIKLDSSNSLNLIIQCSSLGKWMNLPTKILNYFKEMIFKSSCEVSFHIIYPSVTEMLSIPKNVISAGYFYSPKLSKKTLLKFSGITDALGFGSNFNYPSHSKTYLLKQDQNVLWYYMSSANLSMTSWSNGSNYMKVKTHELGVSVISKKDLKINYINIAEAIVKKTELDKFDTVGNSGEIDVFGLINDKYIIKNDSNYENFDFNSCLQKEL
ncbi:hypothetical protein QEN19_003003 [Hanseniaspora menglaensis]